MKPSVAQIDALLPQTQCGECGFKGCLPYAQALHTQLAPINLCPPGGINTLKALGKLLAQDPHPYLKDMARKARPPQVAAIDEAACIGCTKCIQACPVDAIMGSAKQMHVIITQDCTGCGLCVDPCPVDCIELLTIPEATYSPLLAKTHFEHKKKRLLREQQINASQHHEKRTLKSTSDTAQAEREAKKAYILAALERVKLKKS